MLEVASTPSTLQAPTATAARSVCKGSAPTSSPIKKPAIVASPEPVVPATATSKHGASRLRPRQALAPSAGMIVASASHLVVSVVVRT